MRQQFTATLTGNRRDIHLVTPKVLLLNVFTEDGTLFRDHVWVLEEYFTRVPKGHQRKKYKIVFTAIYKEYVGGKTTLCNIKDIVYIKE